MTDAPSPRDVVLASALEALVVAFELPGDHCEVAQALPPARAALASAAVAYAEYMVTRREPTKAMVLAALDRKQQGSETCMYRGIYRAMTAEGERQWEK